MQRSSQQQEDSDLFKTARSQQQEDSDLFKTARSQQQQQPADAVLIKKKNQIKVKPVKTFNMSSFFKKPSTTKKMQMQMQMKPLKRSSQQPKRSKDHMATLLDKQQEESDLFKTPKKKIVLTKASVDPLYNTQQKKQKQQQHKKQSPKSSMSFYNYIFGSKKNK